MKSLIRFLPAMLIVLTVVNAQPQLSVSIHIPALSVDPGGESYSPMPLPVQATIYNTGNVASAQLSARISFTADLALDASEQGAVIKIPSPSAVAPNDSAKVEWLLYHPPSFAAKNYRIRIWLLTSAVDSFETQKLFTLPAMAPPDFKFSLGPIPTLQVRQDSLGYEMNPFTLALRLANQGGTTIETVSVHLHLPQDYILEPTTQANPYNVPIPMPPPTAGNPRIDVLWNVRYYGATMQARSDTFRIVAKGKDIAGNWREEDTLFIVHVAGMSPALDCTLPGANALLYDATSIYSPQPYRLTARIENIGEQWAQLLGFKAMLSGDGVTLIDAAVKPAGPSLLPGTVATLTWDVAVERRAAARQFTAMVEVTDLDGRKRLVEKVIQIPGKPYHLTVENLTASDTLSLNAEGTNFLTPDIPIRYSIGNRTWYNSSVQFVKVQTQGIGIKAPPFHEHQPMTALAPDEVSATREDVFTVEGQVQGRIVNFHVLAVSDRGDTARGTRPVFVPGLRPVLTLHRNGTDALRYDRVNDYAPNPFYQEYVLCNIGHVAVRVDSLRLAYTADGVSTPDPLFRSVGWNLNPGDSLVTRWNFLAYKRDTDRELDFEVSAWTSGEQHLTLAHTLSIPGLYPVPELVFTGDDTLAYDPVHVYSPNPFTRTLTVRNIGTDDLRCDSVRVSFVDDRVILNGSALWKTGAILEADSALELSWSFTALERDVSVRLPITATLYHGRGSNELTGEVYIPALTPGLDVSFTGDSFLSMEAENVYTPSPFARGVRVTNNGTGMLRLDSIRLKSNDPDIRFDEAPTQHINQELQAGHSATATWHGRSGPRFVSGNVLLEFDIHHSGGEVLPTATDISIPGRANYFNVVDVNVPAQLALDQSGYGYRSEGFALRFRAHNDCWAKTVFTRANISANVQDGITRIAAAGDIQPNELLAPTATSQLVVDSFVVLPRTTERFVTLDITVYDGFMRKGTAKATVYIPAALATSVSNLAARSEFRIASLYPMPVHAGEGAELSVVLEGVRGGILTLELTDVLGRVVSRGNYDGGEGASVYRLHPGGVARGTYLLRATNGSRSSMRLLQLR
jgi:hypothetical protein